uniref:Uncharacterized protein n=1 Tax=Cannabis sativa TaxID=3483 RepID=A0A803NJI2_CANSA
MGLLNSFLDAISSRPNDVHKVAKEGKNKGKKGQVSRSGSQKLAPQASSQEFSLKAPALCNGEFSDYKKWGELVPDIINRVEMTEILCPRVGTNLALFLSDMLNQSATTSCKLGTDRFAMMASGDPVYMQRVDDSLDKAIACEKKATKIERDRGDKYKEEYTQALFQISDLEADLKQDKLDLKESKQKHTLLSQEYEKKT